MKDVYLKDTAASVYDSELILNHQLSRFYPHLQTHAAQLSFLKKATEAHIDNQAR